MFQLFFKNRISQLVEWLIVPVPHKLPWQKSYYFWGSPRSFSILQVRFQNNAVLFLLLKIHCSLLKYTSAPRASRRAAKTRVKERVMWPGGDPGTASSQKWVWVSWGERVEIECADGYTTLTILKNTGFYTLTVKVLVTQSCPTLCDPRDYVHQAPLSMEFCRQEYCSGLPFPPPGESSWPRDWTWVSCIGRQILYHLSHQGSPWIL